MKITAIAATVLALFAAVPANAAEEVNVYSYRQPFLIKPMFDAFERETGIKVNVVFANKGLVERLKNEGPNSPADLIFTVDIGRLSEVYEAGLTQPVTSDVLSAIIPPQYREPAGHWFGLTTRARLIYASKDRVAPGEITSYEDLADPKWAGRICTRSGNHVYQIALLASFIAHYGEEEAEKWLRGVKNNLARKPQGNDRNQVKAISEGVCDLSLGNNYYYALMLADEEQAAWADAANVIFPTLGNKGTHVNLSGIALTKSAPNSDNAIKLMEFLAGDLAQQMYAEQNHEYPINANVPWSGILKSLGTFEPDDMPLATVSTHRATAAKIVNRVGYDQ